MPGCQAGCGVHLHPCLCRCKCRGRDRQQGCEKAQQKEAQTIGTSDGGCKGVKIMQKKRDEGREGCKGCSQK